MVDPRLRQRVQVVPVRPSVRVGVTNAELLENFRRTTKLSQSALATYSGSIRDFIQYMRTPEGREIPAREWTKDNVWAYLHHVEANYCANFRPAPFKGDQAVCRARVWVGLKPASEAVQSTCVDCPSFRRPMISHRVNALSKFFKFLARVGAILVNFMADVVTDFWDEAPVTNDAGERRRNPTVEEMVRLVNETAHPLRRAFYACSAKWFFRPNEMLSLDRYASFGITPPEGVATPVGFDDAWPAHPHLLAFAAGGQLVYVPKKKDASGNDLPDKRQGNRWSVIDAELRPILEQCFAWWERVVRRDAQGRPVTSKLWLTQRGTPMTQKRMELSLFANDCIRLGLMRDGDESKALKAWTCHCQRHFGEKVLEMADTPDDWCNHFRGDKRKDARDSYFRPKPEEVQAKYLQWVPLLGFKPIPEAPTQGPGIGNQRDMHHHYLAREIERVQGLKRREICAASVRITSGTTSLIVPRRMATAFMFALQIRQPGATCEVVEIPATRADGHSWRKADFIELCQKGLSMLDAE